MGKAPSERRFVRRIISQVHPDRFAAHPAEQAVNSESLKRLHEAVEALAEGSLPGFVALDFYARETDSAAPLRRVQVQLRGSLLPLYEAFDVISAEEAAELRAHDGAKPRDVDFLEWLGSTIQEASATAAELDSLKAQLKALCSAMVEQYGLLKVTCSEARSGAAMSVGDASMQIRALNTVRNVLEASPEATDKLQGLSVVVHPPEIAPVRDYHWQDAASGLEHHVSTSRWAEVARSGEVEVVAHLSGLADRLASLDVTRARALTALSSFWHRRQRELAKSAADVLGCNFVWPDENCRPEDFCLWAGRVMGDRLLRESLAGKAHSFNILVHNDLKVPAASFLSSCSTVQVHHRCAPRQLLEFLVSHEAALASEQADRRLSRSQTEEDLLAEAKRALGARHIVRICSRDHTHAVADALRRLIDNAAAIRKKISLEGVCLALDDNFHLWDSGYVSIPYDFDIATVATEVTKLLAPGTAPASAPAAAPALAAAEVAPSAQPVVAPAAEEPPAAPSAPAPEPAAAPEPALAAASPPPPAPLSEDDRAPPATDVPVPAFTMPALPPAFQPSSTPALPSFSMSSLIADATVAAQTAAFRRQLAGLSQAVALAKAAGPVGQDDVQPEAEEGGQLALQPATAPVGLSRSALVAASSLLPHMRRQSRDVVRAAQPPAALPPPPPPRNCRAEARQGRRAPLARRAATGGRALKV